MVVKNKLFSVSIGIAITALLGGTAQAATLEFKGVGAGATTALNDFKAAIGGGQNAGGPKPDGFRVINWDGVRLDGTDANPRTRVIDLNNTVGIPIDRFQAQGAIYAEEYAVSGDGFASVNPDTAGQFPAFSPRNTFAMFDFNSGEFEDRFIEQSFTFAGTRNAAGTRGFGAIFTDVEAENSSFIEYFSGTRSLGKFAVPASQNSGESQFLGVLFDDPIVTDVTLTVGDKALFSFDGTTIKSFGAEDLANGIDLAVTDDFVFAEPTTAVPVPEPTTSLGMLLFSVGGAFYLRKHRHSKQKLSGQIAS